MYQITKTKERKPITFKEETYDPSTYQVKNLLTNQIEIEFEGLGNVMRYLKDKGCMISYNWDKDMITAEPITGCDITRPIFVPCPPEK